VEASIVLDRAEFAALFAQEVLGEELLERLVDRHVSVVAVLGERDVADLRHESGERPGRLGLCVGPHGPVDATHPAVGVPAGGDGELQTPGRTSIFDPVPRGARRRWSAAPARHGVKGSRSARTMGPRGTH
jgi:hypothetical protein